MGSGGAARRDTSTGAVRHSQSFSSLSLSLSMSPSRRPRFVSRPVHLQAYKYRRTDVNLVSGGFSEGCR